MESDGNAAQMGGILIRTTHCAWFEPWSTTIFFRSIAINNFLVETPMNKLLAIIAVTLLTASTIIFCSGKTTPAPKKEDAAKPAARQATTAPDTVTTTSGLKYIVEKKGNGAKPAKGALVIFCLGHYRLPAE